MSTSINHNFIALDSWPAVRGPQQILFSAMPLPLVALGAVSSITGLVTGMREAVRTCTGNKASCCELISRCERLVQALLHNPRWKVVDVNNGGGGGLTRPLDPTIAEFMKRLYQTMQRAHAIVCITSQKGWFELHLNRSRVSYSFFLSFSFFFFSFSSPPPLSPPSFISPSSFANLLAASLAVVV